MLVDAEVATGTADVARDQCLGQQLAVAQLPGSISGGGQEQRTVRIAGRVLGRAELRVDLDGEAGIVDGVQSIMGELEPVDRLPDRHPLTRLRTGSTKRGDRVERGQRRAGAAGVMGDAARAVAVHHRGGRQDASRRRMEAPPPDGGEVVGECGREQGVVELVEMERAGGLFAKDEQPLAAIEGLFDDFERGLGHLGGEVDFERRSEDRRRLEEGARRVAQCGDLVIDHGMDRCRQLWLAADRARRADGEGEKRVASRQRMHLRASTGEPTGALFSSDSVSVRDRPPSTIWSNVNAKRCAFVTRAWTGLSIVATVRAVASTSILLADPSSRRASSICTVVSVAQCRSSTTSTTGPVSHSDSNHAPNAAKSRSRSSSTSVTAGSSRVAGTRSGASLARAAGPVATRQPSARRRPFRDEPERVRERLERGAAEVVAPSRQHRGAPVVQRRGNLGCQSALADTGRALEHDEGRMPFRHSRPCLLDAGSLRLPAHEGLGRGRPETRWQGKLLRRRSRRGPPGHVVALGQQVHGLRAVEIAQLLDAELDQPGTGG